MNADNVNKWLTLSANIGVVIGLILLLVELDQNSDLVRAQGRIGPQLAAFRPKRELTK